MEISYWGAFRGRGGGPMLILEDSKTSYTWNKINGEARAKIVAENKGVFAPPFLKDGDVVLAQTTSICAYLGKKLGYYPEAKDEFQALMMAQNIADVWAECYGKDLGWMASGRAEQWMACLESGFQKYPGTFFMGAKPTYVDFAGLNVFLVVEFMQGEAFNKLLAKYKGLGSWFAAMKARPNLQTILKNGAPVLHGSKSYAKLSEKAAAEQSSS